MKKKNDLTLERAPGYVELAEGDAAGKAEDVVVGAAGEASIGSGRAK